MPPGITVFPLKPRRVVELFWRGHFERICYKFVTNKEGVHAAGVCADERVTLLLSKRDETCKGNAVVVGLVPLEDWIIGDSDCRTVGDACIVLDDDNAGMVVLNCFPDPVVVSIDVDGEEIEFFWHIVLTKELFDVLCGDEFLSEVDVCILKSTIHKEPLPSSVLGEVTGIALNAILYAELYEELVCRPYHSEDSVNDAVFLVLGIFSTFDERNPPLESVEVSDGDTEPFMEGEDDGGKEPPSEPIKGFFSTAPDAICHTSHIVILTLLP